MKRLKKFRDFNNKRRTKIVKITDRPYNWIPGYRNTPAPESGVSVDIKEIKL
jgi:hypothetical protein